MYCVNCGVKLAPTEEKCPLCGVPAYHPYMEREKAEPLYPKHKMPEQQVSPKGTKIILTTLFLLPAFITLWCDLNINQEITWSGYVVGSLQLVYVALVLPYWFRKPNPVVFLPCVFLSAALFLLYIDLHMHSNWFVSFALPVTGFVGLWVTAVVALLRYLPRRAGLYILGGAGIALGAFMPLMEYLMCYTFHAEFIAWSAYPLIALVLFGGMLIFLAICRPARESMERRFFL